MRILPNGSRLMIVYALCVGLMVPEHVWFLHVMGHSLQSRYLIAVCSHHYWQAVSSLSTKVKCRKPEHAGPFPRQSLGFLPSCCCMTCESAFTRVINKMILSFIIGSELDNGESFRRFGRKLCQIAVILIGWFLEKVKMVDFQMMLSPFLKSLQMVSLYWWASAKFSQQAKTKKSSLHHYSWMSIFSQRLLLLFVSGHSGSITWSYQESCVEVRSEQDDDTQPGRVLRARASLSFTSNCSRYGGGHGLQETHRGATLPSGHLADQER